MKRRKWKPEQKALIVLEGLKGRPIGDLCAEHEISQAQYYQWRDQFLANAASAASVSSGRYSVVPMHPQRWQIEQLVSCPFCT